MKDIFLLVSAVLSIVAVVPYLADVVKGVTKPRIATWLVWTVLSTIAATAALMAGETRTAIFSATAATATVMIVILGAKKGDNLFNKFDTLCLVGAVAGLLLWYIFNSPVVAILAVLIIDTLGGLPTLKHGWQRPFEETWQTFTLAGISGALAVASVDDLNFIAIAFPLYIAIFNLLQTSIILYRRKEVKTTALL